MECNRLFAEDPEETASRPIPPLLGTENPFYNAFGNAMNQYYNNISSNSHLSSSSGSSFFNNNNSSDISSPNHFTNYSGMFDLPDTSPQNIISPLNTTAPLPLKKTRSCQNLIPNESNIVVNGPPIDKDEKDDVSSFAGYLRRYRNK